MSMWTVIYIAPTAAFAYKLQTKLSEEGFLVKIRPISVSKKQFEVIVPAGEIEEIQEVLHNFLYA